MTTHSSDPPERPDSGILPSRGRSIRVDDDRGRAITLVAPPERVVSLVPSDTYSLARLGDTARLVGRTRYCVAPSEVDAIDAVGGTKDCDVDRVVALRPDLVIANQEENNKRDIDRLEDQGIKVFVSFPRTVAQGVAHLARLAVLMGHKGAGKDSQARDAVAEAYHRLRAAESRLASRSGPPVRVFAPIWMDPLMTVHGDTFISDVIALCGGSNVFADRERRYPLAADHGKASAVPPSMFGSRDTRYPRITLDEIVAREPDVVLLPDEPHPFTEQDRDIFRKLPIPAASAGRIHFCDGKDLMWYGARGVEGLERISALIAEVSG